MKKLLYIILCITLLSIFTGCNKENNIDKANDLESNLNNEVSTDSDIKQEVIPIYIKIGDSTFEAQLNNNEAVQNLINKFPLKIKMKELNGKEKCYSFSEKITNEKGESPKVINKGDIMIWSGNYLAIFYETYSNSYGGYVPIGHIDDVTTLEEALGKEDVEITFSLEE